MTQALSGRRIVLGVSGSIAAYKALTLASRLTADGADVDVILTRAAGELVRPLAFQALTHRPVLADLWAPTGVLAMDHVALARTAELLLVAPATADVLARLALGLADDALSTTALACRAPLLLAPAMEPNMWAHPAVRGHVETLSARGARFVGPVAGRLASGAEGLGRMAEPDEILAAVGRLFQVSGDLAGRRILVTAGPTREPLDPVRYLSNHSSGTMGLAIAQAARNRGAAVTLVLGPVALAPPAGIATIPVDTAADMLAAVLSQAPSVDAVIMAAAVADYRPQVAAERKIKKSADALTLALAPNPDILVALDGALAGAPRPPMRVGFAAETEDLVANARAKLRRKGLDLVVANEVPASFGGKDSAAVLVTTEGETALGRRPKADVADAILDAVVAWLARHRAVQSEAR
jgi:phosphopantothenoylcysteine decarboxylase/phosphopantothenate--cysteine ligase